MDSKVIITADAAGNVITKSERNPEYGYVRVEQLRLQIDDTGFARRKKLSAIIQGKLEDLNDFGWTANQEMDGKIVVRESLKPFNTTEPERDIKRAGESGIVCKVEDKPIYRKHLYTIKNSAEDVEIPHTNRQEIISAYALQNVEPENNIEEEEDFTL